MFLMGELRLEGDEASHQVKVRNLSNGGLMAEANLRVMRGQLLSIRLRNIGLVEGSVAWVQGNRFGVAFRHEVDARLARFKSTVEDSAPRYTRPGGHGGVPTQAPLRKL